MYNLWNIIVHFLKHCQLFFALSCFDMFHQLWNIYVSPAMKHINLSNPYISTLLIDSLSISPKGLFSTQGSGSIFRTDHRKISTLSPLHSEILAVLYFRQADVPKTRIYIIGLLEPLYRQNRQCLRSWFFLFCLTDLRNMGASPKPPCQPPP